MNLTRLQKELLLWIMFFLLCAFVCGIYIDHTPNRHPGLIRLHIIANSDSPADQSLKLKVRNEMIAFMEGRDSIEESRAYIDGNLPKIEEIAENVIAEEGKNYGASARRKVTFIREKAYDDLVLPAGNYETLNITLGRGRGQNWWCVIFPQLCLIDGSDADGSGAEGSAEGEIVLKSKIKEMIRETEAENSVK